MTISDALDDIGRIPTDTSSQRRRNEMMIAELAVIEAAQNERVLCEMRAAELRQAIAIARRDVQGLADDLQSVLDRQDRLNTFLLTGLRPVE